VPDYAVLVVVELEGRAVVVAVGCRAAPDQREGMAGIGAVMAAGQAVVAEPEAEAEAEVEVEAGSGPEEIDWHGAKRKMIAGQATKKRPSDWTAV